MGRTITQESPGTITMSWTPHDPQPTDYRINWGLSDEPFPSYKGDTGNAYPNGTTHTATGAEEGQTYKARVRARYRGDEHNSGKSTPWSETATFTVPYTDNNRQGAIDLGDITDHSKTKYSRGYTLDGVEDKFDYLKITLNEPKKVVIGLRQLDAAASIALENDEEEVIATKSTQDKKNVWVSATVLEGTYHIKVTALEAKDNRYKVSTKTKEPKDETVRKLRGEDPDPTPTPTPTPTATQTPTPTPTPTPPPPRLQPRLRLQLQLQSPPPTSPPGGTPAVIAEPRRRKPGPSPE